MNPRALALVLALTALLPSTASARRIKANWGRRDHRRPPPPPVEEVPDWRQLESLLFVVDMHKNILDMSERFSESVIQLCKTEKKKFDLDRNRLKATISKQDRLTRTMLKAIRSVTVSWGKVLWAKVRRWVRMHHYAHKLWEYKFSSRVAQIDMENGQIMIQNLL